MLESFFEYKTVINIDGKLGFLLKNALQIGVFRLKRTQNRMKFFLIWSLLRDAVHGSVSNMQDTDKDFGCEQLQPFLKY